MTLNNLGGVETARGEHARARAYHERAVALRERALGPEHPLLASSRANLGVSLLMLGETRRGRARAEAGARDPRARPGPAAPRPLRSGHRPREPVLHAVPIQKTPRPSTAARSRTTRRASAPRT
ncbi:MAG: tetratricopeptide repeat protein [Myxococcales bacterium]|nr:tetratricopeptide repeat protein [Myxococcales bacterium]